MIPLLHISNKAPRFELLAITVCRLQEYDLETAIASLVEANSSLKIDTQHLKVNLRVGSLYQFIGELLVNSDNNEAILRARVGRNVDGMDLNLYHQSLQLLRDFQAEHIDHKTA
ncbi:OLC1v1020695C2 [Oldenlandia corymbosa var. corymbosa]|uniref:OLC1v1020695C2 n=1 Tax=Oldenlandia corymbosa var. corymbosa TaxID=529605 RepID=A0AAV1EHH5_OLDCO|nr:OLC1v1020695C2 [Oldenlandia corymbosa var. corymbosa]